MGYSTNIRYPILYALISFFLVLSTTISSFAASDYISFPYDTNGEVYYRGEVIDIFFRIDDIWTYYYTMPQALLYNSNHENIAINYFDTVEPNGTSSEITNFRSNNLSNGKYTVVVVGAPVDEDGDLVDSITDWEIDQIDINLKTLAAPTSLKAVAGKKKVTLTFKKAAGASKYYIYRSTKKGSGYKKIATTTKTKYVDKKVKKGKKYYYKVKSVRSVTNTITSSYSKIAKSKKVK